MLEKKFFNQVQISCIDSMQIYKGLDILTNKHDYIKNEAIKSNNIGKVATNT